MRRPAAEAWFAPEAFKNVAAGQRVTTVAGKREFRIPRRRRPSNIACTNERGTSYIEGGDVPPINCAQSVFKHKE